MAPERYAGDVKYVILQHILMNDISSISIEIALRLIHVPPDFTNEKLSVVQVMVGAIMQQANEAITWTNLDKVLCLLTVLLGANELSLQNKCIVRIMKFIVTF